MCQKNVFHPTGPCCGATGLCKRFPSIDWNKTAWKMVHPGAKWAEQLYVPHSHGGPVVSFGPGDPNNGKYSYSGTAPPTHDALYSWHDYYMPAGVFRSFNVASCKWQVDCRERQCPYQYLLAWTETTGVSLKAEDFVQEESPWEMYRIPSYPTADPINGPFVLAQKREGNFFFSWRSILRGAECVVLPALRAQGVQIFPDEAIEGGLLFRLEAARQLVNTPATDLPWLFPHWIDRAVAFTLSGGITFGVESDRRSPYFNQLVVSESGQYDSETIDDVTTTWLASTPWELVSGNANSPAFGQTLRFERTDDNDTLPAWLELELIRI